MRKSKKITAFVVILALLLFAGDMKTIVSTSPQNDNPSMTRMEGKSAKNTLPQKTQDQDYLNMSLEELMQVPVISMSI